uniref:Uncharacterized protein n=1 Tax=Arundo donax TaxID=35708 RepID=A0A0A9E9F3_ARUDO
MAYHVYPRYMTAASTLFQICLLRLSQGGIIALEVVQSVVSILLVIHGLTITPSERVL